MGIVPLRRVQKAGGENGRQTHIITMAGDHGHDPASKATDRLGKACCIAGWRKSPVAFGGWQECSPLRTGLPWAALANGPRGGITVSVFDGACCVDGR